MAMPLTRTGMAMPPLRPAVLLKRSLIFVHRWLGVALSLVFLLWFVSGIVMMYWGFPGVSQEDRLQRAPALVPERITVTATQALAAIEGDDVPRSVRLTSFDGRPVYRFGGGGGRGRGGGRGPGGAERVFADDGLEVGPVDDATVDRAAAAWAGRPATEADRVLVEEIDQWTVGGAGRGQRPLYKYSWPDGQQAYVSGQTADVVQYTTTSSRFWAYLGAIPHWLYFTPIRKNPREWFSFVVWSSMIGTAAALMGVVIAVWMYSPRQRYRHAGVPTSIPYKGWKRWHTITGLVFGVVTTTWAFSGLLSMGPFPITERLSEWAVPADPSADPAQEVDLEPAMRGGALPLAAYEEKPPAMALATVRDFRAKELEFLSYDGAPFYLATNGQGETRVIPVRGEPRAAFDVDDLMRRIRARAGDQLAELSVKHEYDAYYLDRRGRRPLPVIYARLRDPGETRYYVDPKTATIVETYNARDWVSRWLYHGLHSLDLPWLYKYRPLWDIVVITLMLGGTALCLTSLVLAWRVLARKLALVWARLRPPDEDLIAERP
jgi:hypothetical protein